MAKAMLKLGQQEDATEWLRRARDMPIRNPDVSIEFYLATCTNMNAVFRTSNRTTRLNSC